MSANQFEQRSQSTTAAGTLKARRDHLAATWRPGFKGVSEIDSDLGHVGLSVGDVLHYTVRFPAVGDLVICFTDPLDEDPTPGMGLLTVSRVTRTEPDGRWIEIAHHGWGFMVEEDPVAVVTEILWDGQRIAPSELHCS
jgi:hypothetical protein